MNLISSIDLLFASNFHCTLLEQSKIFPIMKALPKGALLHAHFDAMFVLSQPPSCHLTHYHPDAFLGDKV